MPFPLPKICLVLSLATLSFASAAEDAFYQDLAPFFENHCYECHDDLSTKGDLDLYALGTNLDDEATFAKWVRVYDRVTTGEMPPKEEPRPKEGGLTDFRKHLATPLASAHEEEKGTVLRRLNRQEYENTLSDLFGIRLDVKDNFPEDGMAHGFDNVGEALSISMVQMQQYLAAAKLAVDTAIASRTAPIEPETRRVSYADTREGKKHIGDQWLKAPDGAVVVFPKPGSPTGMLRDANAKKPGYYRIRVHGYAYQSDKPVVFSVGATTFQRGADKPTYGYYSFQPGKPQTVELEGWMDDRFMIQIEPEGIHDTNYSIKKVGISNYEGPGLAISWVELEGPITGDFPTRGHHLILDGIERNEIEPRNPKDKEKPWYVPRFELVTENQLEAAKQSLLRIANRAYRRPVEESEITPYLDLFQTELAKEATMEEALRSAVEALLCSPDFLYLREPSGALDDYRLASRLSYFLSRTLPDDALLELAGNGSLTADPANLEKEALRLMEDPHFDRFITDFTNAWLDLRNIEFTNPDAKLFPEFDPYLQDSMLAETREFFRTLLEENLSVVNFVKSDFSLLNKRLAEHYGIQGVSSPEVIKVSLSADSRRGGFLSQASILKVSANGTNTSPVLRGVWINERILGRHPQPPPPGIPGVEPDIRGTQTLRDQLDKHRDSENCSACHSMIDPPGFALESFNPVGGWRDHYRSLGEGEKSDTLVKGRKVRYRIGLPVDASGILQDGSNFADFETYRDLLAEDPDLLAKAFATKLLTFATGREMGFSDRPEINRIVAESAKNGHGVRELVLLTVTSEIFRHK